MKSQNAIYPSYPSTLEVIRRQHKAIATEESYSNWLRRYIRAIRRLLLSAGIESWQGFSPIERSAGKAFDNGGFLLRQVVFLGDVLA